MLTLHFESLANSLQVIISVKFAVLALTLLTGTLPNVKVVSTMLYVMVVQMLKCHLDIGEGPQTQLRSSSDQILMHVKVGTIQKT